MNEHMQNFFNPDNFYVQFNFADNEEDVLKFNIKSSELPSIAFGVTTINHSGKVKYLVGNNRDEGSIGIELILDENLYVYTTLLDLNLKYYSQNKTIDSMNMFIMNTQNVPILRFDFEDVFFSNVGGPQLNVSDKETESYISIDLNYGKFSYKRL